MHLEDKSPALAELTEAQREQAMARFHISVLTPSAVFPFQERHKRLAWACEPWNDGSLSTVPMVWLD